MNYQEKKITKIINKGQDNFIEHNFEYKCEDLFGEATITSVNKLDGDTLDELVCDIIMAKQIKKGNTPNYEIVFEAVFKPQWQELEDNLQDEYIKEYKETVKYNARILVGSFKKAIIEILYALKIDKLLNWLSKKIW